MMSEYSNFRGARRGNLIVVEFKGNRREVFGNPWEFPFKYNDIAIVEADRGQDAGRVKHLCIEKNSGVTKTDFDVIRRGTTQDSQRIARLREYEVQALALCREKIIKHSLPMKLVEAEYRFDGLKLTFFFTADGRIDFRDLVKDLAGTFRTRIELRQIGARDETKRTDSYGSCGRRLCCVSFIDSFQPITTQMAKVQNLILNPSKLSGCCGRLKCCLAFEHDIYIQGIMGKSPAAIGQEDEDSSDIDKLSD